MKTHYAPTGPSRCHPNPCENDGKCIDKFDFFGSDDRLGTKKVAQDTESRFYFHMNRNPGMEIITPVDPKLLSENGDKGDMDISMPALNQAANLVEEKRGKMPSKHSEITIAKRNRILGSKMHALVKSKHAQPHGKAVTRSSIEKPQKEHSWKYTKDANFYNQTASKRSLILTKKLPLDVDPTQLEIDGFVCICTEHYKGKKCEGKAPSAFWES